MKYIFPWLGNAVVVIAITLIYLGALILISYIWNFSFRYVSIADEKVTYKEFWNSLLDELKEFTS